MAHLRHKKKRPLNRKESPLRDTSLVVIATEGEKTEPRYFEFFHSHRVQVLVLPTEEGKSSPEHVLERLRKFDKEYRLEKEDTFWLVVDVDRWSKANLARVAQEASQRGYGPAISNPCFELWLLLHFEDVGEGKTTCTQLLRKLSKHLPGYTKSNLRVEAFTLPSVKNAVKRAKCLRTHDGERWPSKTGTDVYRVVQQILKMR